MNEWKDFNEGVWTKEINVSDFIQKNYKNYDGSDGGDGSSFLVGVTDRTKKVWDKCTDLLKEELK